MKALIKIAALGVLLVSGSAFAEVEQECILQGQVMHKGSTESGKEVRVSFNKAQHGDEARCKLKDRGVRARIQFKADPSDRLHELPNGSEVKYRYREQNGKDQWELVKASKPTA